MRLITDTIIILLLVVITLTRPVLCNTFYGKLVLKISVASKKNSAFAHRPTVFATRRSTYLKKDGDVFKIHIPGIAKNATPDTISFESVRFPGYYLRHRSVENDYKFRIAKPMQDDKQFNPEATFIIKRHTGIEGSGMLRLFEDPTYYLCVRKYNFADSALKAMQNDNTEDFRARCSFFIQKLKPENVKDAVKKSTRNSAVNVGKPTDNKVAKITNTVQKLTKNPPSDVFVRKMLDDYVKKIETEQKDFFVNQLSNYQGTDDKNTKKTVPPAQQIVRDSNPTVRSWPWNTNGGKTEIMSSMYQNENSYGGIQNPTYEQGFPQQSYVYPRANMLSYFPVITRYDPTKQYIRAFFQNKNDEKLANEDSDNPVEVGTADASWKKDMRPENGNRLAPVSPTKQMKKTSHYWNSAALSKNNTKTYHATPISSSSKTHFSIPVRGNNNPRINKKNPNAPHQILKDTKHSKQRHQEPALNIDGSIKNVSISSTRSIKIKNATLRLIKVKNATLKHRKLMKIGPQKPISLSDFSKHTHREPSLNLDGLMTRVKLPSTRSNIFAKNKNMSSTDAPPETAPVNNTEYYTDSTTVGSDNAFIQEADAPVTSAAQNGNKTDNSSQAVLNATLAKPSSNSVSSDGPTELYSPDLNTTSVNHSSDSTNSSELTELYLSNDNDTSKLDMRNTTEQGLFDIPTAADANQLDASNSTASTKVNNDAKNPHFIEVKNEGTLFDSDLLVSSHSVESKGVSRTLDSTTSLNTDHEHINKDAVEKEVKALGFNVGAGLNDVLANVTTEPEVHEQGVLVNSSPISTKNKTNAVDHVTKKEHLVDESLKNVTGDPEFEWKIFGDDKSNDTSYELSPVENNTATPSTHDHDKVTTESEKIVQAATFSADLDEKNVTINEGDEASKTTSGVGLLSEHFSSNNSSHGNSTHGNISRDMTANGNKTTGQHGESHDTGEVNLAHESKVNRTNSLITNGTSLNGEILMQNGSDTVAHLQNNSRNETSAYQSNLKIETPTRKVDVDASHHNPNVHIQPDASSKQNKPSILMKETQKQNYHSNSNQNQTYIEQVSDNEAVPVEDTPTSDSEEAGDNMDVLNDNNTPAAIANILGQHSSDGLEYENIDKATNFKDLGSSEMKGIAKAMSQLNAQDVSHLQSKMKTIEMMDRTPLIVGKEGMGNTGKIGAEYETETYPGTETGGEPIASNHFAAMYTTTQSEPITETGEETSHGEGYASLLSHSANAALPIGGNNNIQENPEMGPGDTATAQDAAGALQEASMTSASAPVTVGAQGAGSHEMTETSHETRSPSQGMQLSQETTLIENGGSPSVHTRDGQRPIKLVSINEDGSHGITDSNGENVQRSSDALLSSDSSISSALAGFTNTQGDASTLSPQILRKIHQIDRNDARAAFQQAALNPEPESATITAYSRSDLKKNVHPQKTISVKGIAKNTVIKVPVAISYTKVKDEDNPGVHKLEHILKDVMHDVKSELHNGGPPGPTHAGGNGNIFPDDTVPGDSYHQSSHTALHHDEPIIGVPQPDHPVTLLESEHYAPAKSVSGVFDAMMETPKMEHEVNVIRHTHHVVTVKSEAEKEKMVSGLVDYDTDRCVSLQLLNDLGSRYRLISSINKHGYTPRGKVFTLKTVFKDPSSHKFVSFHAIDESEPNRQVTLDGARELVSVPVSCQTQPKVVRVLGAQPSKLLVHGISKKDKITNKLESVEDEVVKKDEISHPRQFVIHNIAGNSKQEKVTHIYMRNHKKYGIAYPEILDSDTKRDSNTFFGKLVLKMSPLTARSLSAAHPYIFATRRTTYLKKNGDVFKIRSPGLAPNAGRDSISFESVRMPGFYLKHRAEENDFKFRIARPQASNFRVFDKEATFVVEKHNGIEGSGMLRLFEKPGWYMCIRKHEIAESALKAMKNDYSPEFRRRCSFFIEKLGSESIMGELVKAIPNKSRLREMFKLGRLSKRKHIHRPATEIRRLLDDYISRGQLELMKDSVQAMNAFPSTNVASQNQVPISNNFVPLDTFSQSASNDQHPWWNSEPNSNHGTNRVNSPAIMSPVLGENVNSLRPGQLVNGMTRVSLQNDYDKTPLAKLSDKIAQLSSSPRMSMLDSYTFDKQPVTGSNYALNTGGDAFEIDRYSRTHHYFNQPRDTGEEDENMIAKKTEISKAYNKKTLKKAIPSNMTKVITAPSKNSINDSVSQFQKLQLLNENGTKLHLISQSVGNGVIKVLDVNTRSDSKKAEDVFDKSKLLQFHSVGSNQLHIANASLNEAPKYVRKKRIRHKFYREDPSPEGMFKHHKKPLVMFDDEISEPKSETVKHLYADAKGHLSTLEGAEATRSLNVKHLYADKNGHISGMIPKATSLIGRLTAPVSGLAEFKKLGKKVKLGVHCKRSGTGVIHVAECNDEDDASDKSVNGSHDSSEEEEEDGEYAGHHHSNYANHNEYSDLGLTEPSHTGHRGFAEEPVDSMTTETADGDKESETEEIYGHGVDKEVHDDEDDEVKYEKEAEHETEDRHHSLKHGDEEEGEDEEHHDGGGHHHRDHHYDDHDEDNHHYDDHDYDEHHGDHHFDHDGYHHDDYGDHYGHHGGYDNGDNGYHHVQGDHWIDSNGEHHYDEGEHWENDHHDKDDKSRASNVGNSTAATVISNQTLLSGFSNNSVSSGNMTDNQTTTGNLTNTLSPTDNTKFLNPFSVNSSNTNGNSTGLNFHGERDGNNETSFNQSKFVDEISHFGKVNIHLTSFSPSSNNDSVTKEAQSGNATSNKSPVIIHNTFENQRIPVKNDSTNLHDQNNVKIEVKVDTENSTSIPKLVDDSRHNRAKLTPTPKNRVNDSRSQVNPVHDKTNQRNISHQSNIVNRTKMVPQLTKKTTNFLNETDHEEDKFESHKDISLGFTTGPDNSKSADSTFRAEDVFKGSLTNLKRKLPENNIIPGQTQNYSGRGTIEKEKPEKKKNGTQTVKKRNKYVLLLERYRQAKDMKMKYTSTNTSKKDESQHNKNETLVTEKIPSNVTALGIEGREVMKGEKVGQPILITRKEHADTINTSEIHRVNQQKAEKSEKEKSNTNETKLNKVHIAQQQKVEKGTFIEKEDIKTEMQQDKVNSESPGTGSVFAHETKSVEENNNDTKTTFLEHNTKKENELENLETEAEEEQAFVENAIENNLGNETALKDELKDIEKIKKHDAEGSGEEDVSSTTSMVDFEGSGVHNENMIPLETTNSTTSLRTDKTQSQGEKQETVTANIDNGKEQKPDAINRTITIKDDEMNKQPEENVNNGAFTVKDDQTKKQPKKGVNNETFSNKDDKMKAKAKQSVNNGTVSSKEDKTNKKTKEGANNGTFTNKDGETKKQSMDSTNNGTLGGSENHTNHETLHLTKEDDKIKEKQNLNKGRPFRKMEPKKSPSEKLLPTIQRHVTAPAQNPWKVETLQDIYLYRNKSNPHLEGLKNPEPKPKVRKVKKTNNNRTKHIMKEKSIKTGKLGSAFDKSFHNAVNKNDMEKDVDRLRPKFLHEESKNEISEDVFENKLEGHVKSRYSHADVSNNSALATKASQQVKPESMTKANFNKSAPMHIIAENTTMSNIELDTALTDNLIEQLEKGNVKLSHNNQATKDLSWKLDQDENSLQTELEENKRMHHNNENLKDGTKASFGSENDMDVIDNTSLEELDNFEDLDSFSGFEENDTKYLRNDFSSEDSKALNDYLLSTKQGPLKIKGLPEQTLKALANDLRESNSESNHEPFAKKLMKFVEKSEKSTDKGANVFQTGLHNSSENKTNKSSVNVTAQITGEKDERTKEQVKTTLTTDDGSGYLDSSNDEQFKTENTAFADVKPAGSAEQLKQGDAIANKPKDATTPSKEGPVLKQLTKSEPRNDQKKPENFISNDQANNDQGSGEKPLNTLTKLLAEVLSRSTENQELENQFTVKQASKNLEEQWKDLNKLKTADEKMQKGMHKERMTENRKNESRKEEGSKGKQKKKDSEKNDTSKMNSKEKGSNKERTPIKFNQHGSATTNVDELDKGNDSALSGIAKAMAEIMAKNAEDDGMKDLDNIDKNAQNILSEADENGNIKTAGLTDETERVPHEPNKKFSSGSKVSNVSPSGNKHVGNVATDAENIASTSESYFVSQNVNEDSTEQGDTRNTTKKGNKSLKETPKSKLHVNVPVSYTKPSLMNIQVTEQQLLKPEVPENRDRHSSNGANKKSPVMTSLSKEKSTDKETEAEIIHEFRKLFDLGLDTIAPKPAPAVAAAGPKNVPTTSTIIVKKLTDPSLQLDTISLGGNAMSGLIKPTSVWEKMKQNAMAGKALNHDNVLNNQDMKQLHSHRHRIVTVKDEAEKERMVNGLVADADRCVSLQFMNGIGNRYKLVSSINNHGYTPRGKVFTLKQVFKDPRAHRYVSFRAFDEIDENRPVLLNGARELISVPVSCKFKPRTIKVSSRQPAKMVNFKKDNVAQKNLRNMASFLGIEDENEQAICPPRCTEYCAVSCPNYCCSAPIPGGERAPEDGMEEEQKIEDVPLPDEQNNQAEDVPPAGQGNVTDDNSPREDDQDSPDSRSSFEYGPNPQSSSW